MTVAARPLGEADAVRVPSPPRALWPVVGAVAFMLVAAAIGLLVGPVDIGAGAIFGSALSHVPLLGVHSHLSATDSAIVWQLRAPPVVLALLVGGMLALAGGSYQGVFRNPLVDPYLLGVAAGAGLGATIAIAYVGGASSSDYILPIAAFIGAAGAVAMAYGLGATASGGRNPAALVLAGVTIVAFLTAIQTYIQQQHSQTLQEIYDWILGSVDTAGWHEVLLCLPYVVVSSIVILLHRRTLDVLAVGDEEAATLGVNVRRVRITIVVFATIGTASVVAVSGLIGFVGIIVPHFVRLAIGTSYRIVLPLSLLIGGGFLVLCDVIARTVESPAELPIGVVTAFFGAPFFALVLRTSRSFR
jgi:iron complex transport system permease protein